MERITRFYVARINRVNGERGYISINSFNGLPSVQSSIDDAKGFVERKNARTVMQGLNLTNQAVQGNHEYYEIRRDETTNHLTEGLSEDALKWFEEQTEEQPPEETPTEEGTTE